MNNLLANTIQQEIDALQAQLNTIEERAAALRATIAQYKEAALAEQQTAQDAKEIALSALAVAQSAQLQAQAAQEQIAALPTVETPYIASPEEDNEVEIELVYADEDVEVDLGYTDEDLEVDLGYTDEETDNAVETPYIASPEDEPVITEDEPLIIEEEPIIEETPVETPYIASPQADTEPQRENEPLSPPAGGVGGGFPITDIRKAISLGDRFLFQRELFAGNGELMNKTIDHLNDLSSLNEALAYIAKHFDWNTDSPAYELFTNILKRRWQ